MIKLKQYLNLEGGIKIFRNWNILKLKNILKQIQILKNISVKQNKRLSTTTKMGLLDACSLEILDAFNKNYQVK